MGGQWGAQGYQSLRSIGPRLPQGASPWPPGGDFLGKEVTFTKHHYLLCLRHILPAQGAPLATPLGPKASKGRPNAASGPLGEEAQNEGFFGGVPMLTLASKLDHSRSGHDQLLDPFGAFFEGVPPNR